MLATTVRVHDILDCEGFVAATINRTRLHLSPDEREELTLEGIAILYELEERFEPHREGYERPGTFSGYAARFLPGRILRAWHRHNPEHRQITITETGQTTWAYYPRTASLDAIAESRAAAGVTFPSEINARPLTRALPLATPALAATRNLAAATG